jgi:protein gp37
VPIKITEQKRRNMSKTKIPWCDYTWNPVTGCDPISEGCENCYAQKLAFKYAGRFGYDQNRPFSISEHDDRLSKPFHIKRPQKIFVGSMGDVFHALVREDFVLKIIEVCKQCDRHTFLFLTKRPHIANKYDLASENILYGITAENQRWYESRRSYQMMNKNHLHFVSFEPLLGRIDLLANNLEPPAWVIVGGENSTLGAHEMKFSWVVSLYKQCINLSIPFFFKGWGTAFNKNSIEPELIKEIESTKEYPECLSKRKS